MPGSSMNEAAAAFARVGRNDPDALEAGFYRGLSLLFSGSYPEAEAGVQKRGDGASFGRSSEQ